MKCDVCGQAVKLAEGTTKYYIPMEAEKYKIAFEEAKTILCHIIRTQTLNYDELKHVSGNWFKKYGEL